MRLSSFCCIRAPAYIVREVRARLGVRDTRQRLLEKAAEEHALAPSEADPACATAPLPRGLVRQPLFNMKKIVLPKCMQLAGASWLVAVCAGHHRGTHACCRLLFLLVQ